MHYRFSKKPLISRGILVLILVFAIYLLMVFANHPHAVERYYSNGLYPVICYFLHPVLNLFPFSVGDIVYIAIIIYLLYAVVRLIKLAFKKRFAQAGTFFLSLVIGIQVSILVFYIFWGMNYFRPSAAERLNLKDSTFTTAQLQAVTAILIDSANNCRARITPADLKQTNDTIYHRALKAVTALSNSSPNFKTYSPGIKPSLLTPLMNYIGTSGYYNPFTTEAQMNYQMPVFNRPFVACHEMSHQMGYGAEDEANFAGYMAATSSKDRLLRYSGYYLAVEEFMHTMRLTDTVIHKQLKLHISPQVKRDFKAERLYWLSYQNKINVITSVFYDNFLKANNQPEGLNTYNRMVSLVMAMYKKKSEK
jgi:multisubunit Na+/H+ antiporter MnhB subunit